MTKISKKIYVFVCALLVAFSCVFVPKVVKAEEMPATELETYNLIGYSWYGNTTMTDYNIPQFAVGTQFYGYINGVGYTFTEFRYYNSCLQFYNWQLGYIDVYNFNSRTWYYHISVEFVGTCVQDLWIDWLQSNGTLTKVKTYKMFQIDMQNMNNYINNYGVFTLTDIRFTTVNNPFVNYDGIRIYHDTSTVNDLYEFQLLSNNTWTTVFNNQPYIWTWAGLDIELTPITLTQTKSYYDTTLAGLNFVLLWGEEEMTSKVKLTNYLCTPIVYTRTPFRFQFNGHNRDLFYWSFLSEETLQDLWLDGYAVGYNVGTYDGYNTGYNAGYDFGYDVGFDDGVESVAEFNLYKLIGSIFDGVMNIVRGVLDHDLFGFNVLNFLMGLVSIVIIVKVIQMVKGG